MEQKGKTSDSLWYGRPWFVRCANHVVHLRERSYLPTWWDDVHQAKYEHEQQKSDASRRVVAYLTEQAEACDWLNQHYTIAQALDRAWRDAYEAARQQEKEEVAP